MIGVLGCGGEAETPASSDAGAQEAPADAAPKAAAPQGKKSRTPEAGGANMPSTKPID